MRSSGSEPVECLWSITHGSLMVPDVIRGGDILEWRLYRASGALFDLAISFAGVWFLPWAIFCPGSRLPRPIPGSLGASSSFPGYRPVSFLLSHRCPKGFRWMRSGVFFDCWSEDRVLGEGFSCLFRSFCRCRYVSWFLRSLRGLCGSFGFVYGEHSFWQFL